MLLGTATRVAKMHFAMQNTNETISAVRLQRQAEIDAVQSTLVRIG
jgi:hypothetical protein